MKARSTVHVRLLSFSTIALAALAGCSGSVDHEQRLGSDDAPLTASACPDDVPSILAPASDERLWFVLGATGTQNYECRATATGYAWTFVAPVADLLDPGGDVVGTHYAGPTWEWNDGSKVVGARIASGPAPLAGAIPWLLLGAASHAGDGRMLQVTSIQRMNTTGGIAPADGCDADHAGKLASVAYTADYFFYKHNDGQADATQCGG